MLRNTTVGSGDRTKAVEDIRDHSHPLHGSKDLDPCIERVGNAHYVLLGEASHGTHEYYAWRDQISHRLIQEKGSSFIAVEGDWPDCYRLNRYVKGYPDSGDEARTVLHAFSKAVRGLPLPGPQPRPASAARQARWPPDAGNLSLGRMTP
jgi:erythromycin esterase-like protein